MARTKSYAGVLLALALLLGGCAETRKQSIVRENGYLRDHAVEKVAHSWDDVAWTKAGGVTLTMDITAPESSRALPCLIIFHGGSWKLHTAHIMEGMARYITNRGYVVFNVNYRTLPEVKLEQVVEDWIGAVIWVKEHAAEYGGDPKKVAVTGDSAGAHLAAMGVPRAGTRRSIRAIRATARRMLRSTARRFPTGCTTWSSWPGREGTVIGKTLGATYEQAPERYKLLSPEYHVRPALPPQLVLVGNLDLLFPQSIGYVNALRETGDPVELWVYEGQNHTFLNNFWEESGTKGYDRITEFLDKNLKK